MWARDKAEYLSICSGFFNSENTKFCNGKSHKTGTVQKFDSSWRKKRNCTHFCCEIRHTMLDAVTDWVTEALDAFWAKRMGEQLRNILSYTKICIIKKIWNNQFNFKAIKINLVRNLWKSNPPSPHTRTYTNICVQNTDVRNRLTQYMLKNWGGLPEKHGSNFIVEKRSVSPPKSSDILRVMCSPLFSGQSSRL